MRRPSAYCATSSGMAMYNRRESTHPLCPAAVRTRLQSSSGVVGGGSSGFGSTAFSPSFDNSRQSSGRDGGAGGGGGGILDLFGFLALFAVFFDSINDLRTADCGTGTNRCSSTSNFSPSLTCV